MELPKKIEHKIVGKTIIAIISAKKLTLTVDAEKKKELVELIRRYNIKQTKALLDKLSKLFTPKTEKEKTKALAAKKLKNKKTKEAVADIKAAEKEMKNIGTGERTVDGELEELIKTDKRFLVKDGHLYLQPYTQVQLPMSLVKRVKDFFLVAKSLRDKSHIEALINFWQLALLNPNPIARTKLFEYLNQQNITITPNGYFVTYRMVKTTDKPDVFTSNHTHKEEYRMGQVFRIPRAECDEDGSRDCSKGLHTGTHQFIGIVADKKVDYRAEGGLGDGYRVTTKAERSDSYGTGYDRPVAKTDQQFSTSFGNQAVICLVNPMHVVSVPDSHTRKLRACELFFVKTTTPEEVINMVEKDYLGFDHPYKQFEKEEILKMLKETKLQEHIDNALAAKSLKKKQEAQAKLAELNITLGGDQVNQNNIGLADMLKIIKSRVK